MMDDKWSAAVLRALQHAVDALAKCDGDANKARTLLWRWSRHNQSLSEDLLKLACTAAVRQA